MRAIYIDTIRPDGSQSGRWIYPDGPVTYKARRAPDGILRHRLTWAQRGTPQGLSLSGVSVRLTSQTDAS